MDGCFYLWAREHTWNASICIETHPRTKRSCVRAHDSPGGYIHKHACSFQCTYLHVNSSSRLDGSFIKWVRVCYYHGWTEFSKPTGLNSKLIQEYGKRNTNSEEGIRGYSNKKYCNLFLFISFLIAWMRT